MVTQLRPVPDRFWEKVSTSDGCWEWSGGRSPKGYGVLWVSGTFKRAHRISWELANGQIPAGQLVLHRCDNPPCVKPDHLYLGTASDNAHDRDARGRSRSWAKINRAMAGEIRILHASGETQVSLAARYGITQASVSNIVRHKTWK